METKKLIFIYKGQKASIIEDCDEKLAMLEFYYNKYMPVHKIRHKEYFEDLDRIIADVNVTGHFTDEQGAHFSTCIYFLCRFGLLKQDSENGYRIVNFDRRYKLSLTSEETVFIDEVLLNEIRCNKDDLPYVKELKQMRKYLKASIVNAKYVVKSESEFKTQTRDFYFSYDELDTFYCLLVYVMQAFTDGVGNCPKYHLEILDKLTKRILGEILHGHNLN